MDLFLKEKSQETRSKIRFEDVANFIHYNTTNNMDRRAETAVCSFHGGLIRRKDPFPFFMLVAFESGSPLRALLLLAVYPILVAVRLLAGVKASSVESTSKTVLAKFYLEDMHCHAFEAFMSFENRCIVTWVPRIMVEAFLKEYLKVDYVVGSDLLVLRNGYCTGFVSSSSGLLFGIKKLEALKKNSVVIPDVGIGDEDSTDRYFMSWCKKGYSLRQAPRVPRNKYPKPLIFHDGRLVLLPTPAMALTIFLWMPIGILLAILRLIVSYMPYGWSYPLMAILGFTVRVKGHPPSPSTASNGILFVCTHRTLLDPVFLAGVLQRKITAVTYSISRLTEILANIYTVRLTRCRVHDGRTIVDLLERGDVAICPEGTTCREPYLLRFSPLFAELSDRIVPVFMNAKPSLFYGTTASGWKLLDPLFFLMNPSPAYDVEFLPQLPPEMTCHGGRRSIEVANYLQGELARVAGFECTGLTRRDKYRFLAGNDGCQNK